MFELKDRIDYLQETNVIQLSFFLQQRQTFQLQPKALVPFIQ